MCGKFSYLLQLHEPIVVGWVGSHLRTHTNNDQMNLYRLSLFYRNVAVPTTATARRAQNNYFLVGWKGGWSGGIHCKIREHSWKYLRIQESAARSGRETTIKRMRYHYIPTHRLRADWQLLYCPRCAEEVWENSAGEVVFLAFSRWARK